MSLTKNLDMLDDNIKNNKYVNTLERPKKPEGYKKDNYVYDENKSVKWNRDHQKELADKYINDFNLYRSKSLDLEKQFMNDLKSAISIQFDLTSKNAELLANIAYEESHSDGLNSIVVTARDLGELANLIIKNQINGDD